MLVIDTLFFCFQKNVSVTIFYLAFLDYKYYNQNGYESQSVNLRVHYEQNEYESPGMSIQVNLIGRMRGLGTVLE